MGSQHKESGSAGETKVGPLRRFPESRGVAVQVGGVQVAVFNVGGQLFALKDACPHMGASLAEGQVEGQRVTCQWHGWSFDLHNGESGRRSGACARVYELEVRDGEVYVTPPADAAGRPPTHAARPDAAGSLSHADSANPAGGADPADPKDDDEEWVAFDPDKHLKKTD